MYSEHYFGIVLDELLFEKPFSSRIVKRCGCTAVWMQPELNERLFLNRFHFSVRLCGLIRSPEFAVRICDAVSCCVVCMALLALAPGKRKHINFPHNWSCQVAFATDWCRINAKLYNFHSLVTAPLRWNDNNIPDGGIILRIKLSTASVWALTKTEMVFQLVIFAKSALNNMWQLFNAPRIELCCVWDKL